MEAEVAGVHRLRKPTNRRGWTVLLVLFVVLFLMILGFSLIYMMRNEAQQAFNYADAEVAHYLAEAAVNQTFYVLHHHANDENEPPYTDLPKRFATEDKFSFNVIPHWAITPKDQEIPELAVSVVAEAAKRVPGGKILSCDVEYETKQKFEDEIKLKEGILRIIAVGQYNYARRKVVEEHKVFIYKNIPIKYDHVLYINNKEDEIIPGRRANNYSGWKKFLNTISLNSDFDQQSLYVNGKAFIRHLVVPINKTADNSMFSGSLSTKDSMMTKLADKEVDKNPPPSKLDIPTLGALIDWPIGYKEADADGIMAAINSGTRGNTDLTGFDPAGRLRQFFTSLGFRDKKDRTPNKLVGDIRRVYKKRVGSSLPLAGSWETVEEPYVTANYNNQDDPIPANNISGPGYPTANGYYHGENSKTLLDEVEYPKDKIDGLYDETIYKNLAIKHRRNTKKVKYKIGKDEVVQDVVEYYGFGPWQDAPNSSGFFGAIKDLFKSKTGKEAAIANPDRYAIKIKGFEFVDGDVHIEGVYKGRGTIVATGNIYVGNEIVRHPVDDSGKEFIQFPDGRDPEFNDGAYNYLSLVALGTKPGANGEATGKIVFRNAVRDNFSQPGFLRNLFKGKRDMKIQAFCYAKNGIKAQFEDKSWFGMDGDKNVYTVFDGNYVGESLDLGKYSGGNFIDERANWPDRMVIKEDPKWKVILDEMAKNENKRVVIINPKIERFWQGLDI